MGAKLVKGRALGNGGFRKREGRRRERGGGGGGRGYGEMGEERAGSEEKGVGGVGVREGRVWKGDEVGSSVV